MWSVLLSMGWAAPSVEVGGAVDAVAGVLGEEAGLGSKVALRQVEGDLLAAAGPVYALVELDAAVIHLGGEALTGELSTFSPTQVFVLPEVAEVGLTHGTATLAGGIAPSPFLLEPPDGWDTQLVSTSGIEALAPGSVVGGRLRFEGERGAGEIVGGLDAGPGVGLGWWFGGPGDPDREIVAGAGGPVVGARGSTTAGALELGGGLFWWPRARRGGVELGARLPLAAVALQTEVILDLGAGNGVAGQVEVLPDARVTPTVRAQWVEGDAGAAVGVRVDPTAWCALKAEGSWADGAPAGWIEVAVYSPWPP